jgi:hypothetical protein
MNRSRRMRVVLWGVVGVVALRMSDLAGAQAGKAPPPAAPQAVAELAPAAIPDDENAAAFLEQTAPLVTAWGKDHTRFSNSPLGRAYEERLSRGEAPTAEEAAALRDLVAKHGELDALLLRAAACEKYASKGDFTLGTAAYLGELLPRVQRLRSIGRNYTCRMRALRLDGRHDEALRRGIEWLKLLRLHEKEPTLVAYLVTLAVRNVALHELYDAMAAGPTPFDTHAALETELALTDDPQAYGRMLRTERPFAVADAGGESGAGKLMDAVIAASEEPWLEFRKSLQEGGQLSSPTQFGAMADQLIPALAASVDMHGRTLATMRSLRAFNALRMFAKLEGREAAGLAELELPAESLADPFGAGPLQARLTDDGWLIYSVLNNGVDDGGDFRERRDYGVAPARHRSRE